MQTVQPGDRVRIHYTTYAADDCALETSLHREPLEFVAGSRDVVDGVSRAVLGMRLGERKRVPVMPEHAFGHREARWQQTAPRLGLPERVSDGDQLLAICDGHEVDVWIRSLQPDEVVLDANHPLAGETLVYELELVGIGATDLTDSIFA